jgi:glucose-6-phosphate isomerase/transaldolase/glucose-6-phosphate isomerase
MLHNSEIASALAYLEQSQVVTRIWSGDHTVWKPDPTEIADRLGWLTVTDLMRQQASDLASFAAEVRDVGFKHFVLLGMGGSSLGPEVLRQTFGSAPGYPELIVLDSTVPGWVQSVTDAIDPAQTIFLVSSKSGSTTEPNMFYAYFRDLVEQAVGLDAAGQHFIAVTDPESSLARLGSEQGFRRVFLNPTDLGGRYSVLSFFGLVPAAIIGLDVLKLLDRADGMRNQTKPEIPASENLGVLLAAVMGVFSQRGRDKLTVVTSPAISSFGLWVEQLIAESTGKDGIGLVPVAGEPQTSPKYYGEDRMFVYLRLDGDDNGSTDDAVQAVESSGQPVVRLGLADVYHIGAEFFHWEMATAIAGSIICINPFDQPNVQAAKDMTESVLAQYKTSGKLPDMEEADSIGQLLAMAGPGYYLAIMAYVTQSPEVEQALDDLRRRVTEKYGIATTMGYGPRFLHSTGQLHKGGPASGLFLQITAEHSQTLPIAGTPYSFGVLSNAQALGDLQALRASKRRAARVDSGPDPALAIINMTEAIKKGVSVITGTPFLIDARKPPLVKGVGGSPRLPTSQRR